MSYILEYLTSKYPRVREIKVISDGAASQFKQRFLFSNLYVWKDLFSVDLEWNFFATSHGKGVVDGIGGTVKRSVWRQVRAGKENVTFALKFSEIAIHRNPGIHIKYIPSDSIKTQTLEITSRWQKTTAVPNTQKIPCIKPFDSNFVFFSETSNSKFCKMLIMSDKSLLEQEGVCHLRLPCHGKPQLEINEQRLHVEANVNDWVVVKYENSYFPGIVIESTEQDVKVKVMHQAGNGQRKMIAFTMFQATL